jgi:IclR family mhp operon transcriptional activator
MESARPIRALTRGLDALTALNTRDGATVSEVAQEIRLPRTTVYRILETLCDAGFVLSQGFNDDAWMSQSARSLIFELCREIVWPISIATVSGAAMLVRETTDHITPLAIDRSSAGAEAPLLTTAAGRAYLAFCPAAERDGLIDVLARSNKEDDKLARAPRDELQLTLSDIKRQGYAAVTRTRRLVDEVSLGVPVIASDRVIAVITVRFPSSAMPLQTAVERFLPKLRQCAAKISGSFLEHQAAAKAKSAPEAAV